MSSAPDLPPAPQRLAVDYIHAPGPQALLGMSETLAVLGFGALAPSSAAIDDPRYLHVPLSPLREAAAPYEVWRSAGPVATGREGAIRYSHDGALMFGVLEWEEPDGGILHASAHAYAALVAFWRDSDYPHLLRIWNYFDAITLGEGDSERYRQFCVGRVQGLGDVDTRTLPAATAIGSRDGRRVLQVYWLAAREPGLPLENPRQVSAYRYPREYGPQPPSFARAMLPPADSAMPLLLSGTASVVGHRSLHAGRLLAQLDETFANFDSLIGAARTHAPDLPAHFGASTRLKVYVRERSDLPLVAEAFAQRFGGGVPHLILHAVICRHDLAIEIDGVHGTIAIADA